MCLFIHLEKYKTPWNDQYRLLDGAYSASDIQDYTECMIKILERLPPNPPIHIYIKE